MRRREFITLVGGAAAARPFALHAQQSVPVVGFLTGATREGFKASASAFRDELQKAGFVEGRNVQIEYRFAEDHYDRLPALASELIKDRVSVIAADPLAVVEAQRSTKTIPIVFMAGADPVRRGFVASLNRPGGNLTGVTLLAGDLNGKRFGLLHDMVPEAAVIGVLSDPKKQDRDFGEQEVQAAARSLGVTVLVIMAGTESEIEAAFATFARQGVRAVFVINSYFFWVISDRLDELALQHRMALSGELRKFINGGALMSYGPDLEEAWRQVGVYTARILKGEKPADLPVQQPTRYELVINLKTARAIGLTIHSPWCCLPTR